MEGPVHVSILLVGAPFISASSVNASTQHLPAAESSHHQGVAERGDKLMGFSHKKTAHHFLLFSNGGAIEAQTKDAKDTASREAIQTHFSHIMKMFAAGDFTAPMLIHSQNPPGSDTMKRLREHIHYRVEDTRAGARIRISTKNPEAIRAIHEFLRFQIAEQQTGDSTRVQSTR
jgi:hypothetical protein